MPLLANLDGVRHAYRLCFVRAPWAFFTRLSLECQWGDGWETTPYEHCAGNPYDDCADQILRVAVDGPLITPDAGRNGRSLSVLEINRDGVPWLRTENYAGKLPVHIAAGATLESFVESVDLAGGHVSVPLGWGILPAARVQRPQQHELPRSELVI